MRAPKPFFTTWSMVSPSHTPAASSAIASRLSACCNRLPMKPGMSLRTCTGVLPAARRRSMVRATTASLVCSFWITSTSGTRCGGLKKCVPSTRSRRRRCFPISVERMAELLLASTVSAATRPSSSAKSCCLSSSFFRRRLDHEGCALGRGREALMDRDTLQYRGIVAEQRADRCKLSRQRRAHLRRRLENARLMPGRRQQVGDAVPHQPAADHADFLGICARHALKP